MAREYGFTEKEKGTYYLPNRVYSSFGRDNDDDFIALYIYDENDENLLDTIFLETEDINLDGSSAYFTSTQQIPIELSSQNSYLSYTTPPTTPNTYTGEQIILNSGRLVFNSTQDHILLSSAKSINLNTVESVNIDAATQTVIQTPELYLGGIETAQPVVLGNDLVDLLSKVLTDLEYLTGTLQNQLGVPVGTPIGPTNLVAQAINNKIGGYKAELSNILSNTTKTV